jgi:hypothetical protein
MGRSAKNMKRPTKADKVSRQSTHQAPYLRSPSPEARSAIPLFNTSRRGKQLLNYDGMSVDTSAAPSPAAPSLQMEDDEVRDQEEVEETTMVKKKKSLKDKVKSAKDSIKVEEEKMKEKLSGRNKSRGIDKGKNATGGINGILGGADYLKLHEKRPGGALKKRFR